MVDFYRPTKIEVLNATHEGLQNFVEEQFAAKISHTQIASMLEELYGEKVNVQAISNHYRLRWWPQQNAELAEYRKAKNQFRVLKEEAEADPGCDSAKMIELLTINGIVQQRERLLETDPVRLMAELRKTREAAGNFQIEKGKLELDKQRLVNETEELKLKIAQFRQDVEEATDEAKDKIGKGQALTIDDINRIRERVFGLPAVQAQGNVDK